MNINWDIVIKIAGPLLGVIFGKYLERWLLQVPQLFVYLGHASSFTIRGTGEAPPITIHTHSIVIRNGGRQTATKVRIGHHVLPVNLTIFPQVPHEIIRQPDGAGEIVIPSMVKDEQVTISYLYYPPLVWREVHSYTKSDTGYATELNVIPTPQPPRWWVAIRRFLVVVGVGAIGYFVVLGFSKIISFLTAVAP